MRIFKLGQTLKQFVESKRGNVAMMTALVAPVLLMGGGLALDVSNMTAMKTRFQAASDSVSLAVASRIANGDLAVADAETFASNLLVAQMQNDASRFLNMTLEPQITITEVDNGTNKVWDVQVGGTVSQDTTPFSAFFGKDRMEIAIASNAVTGTEEQQGALSMAVIVDVSGSMGWELDPITNSELGTALGISNSQASTVSNKLDDVVSTYGLTPDNIRFILENYVFADCNSMASNASEKAIFLSAINKPSNTSTSDTKKMCKWTTRSTKNDLVTHEVVLDNVETLVSVAHPQIKIDALKEALEELFAQFNGADPTNTYVRTGLSAYAYGVRDTTNMEWGTSSAASYAQTMYASGGTASTDSVKWGFDKLKNANPKEVTEHANKNGQVPDRFILFMTDGDNNNSSDDTSTKSYCDQAKADGITIFSVAFAAPSGGQELLSYCASSADDYYEPETASELVQAFKKIGVSSTKTLTRLTH